MRITYTRDSLQFCNIRDSKPKQKVHEDKRHEQDEDQEKHLVLTSMQWWWRCSYGDGSDGGNGDGDGNVDGDALDDGYDLCQGGCLSVFDEISCEVELAH